MKHLKRFNEASANHILRNEKLDMECIGYKKAYGPGGPGTGEKMWYYKLNYNGHEFLIIDAGMIRLLDMVWSEENEFENGVPDFMSYDFLDNEVERGVKNIEKKGIELSEDEEKRFFTQHEIKEPEPVIIPDRVGGVYTDDEVTEILNILYWEFDFREDGGYHKITQEIADWANENGHEKLLDELVGYKFKVDSDGDHRNDGQMVDYYFTLKSPSGGKTKFETEMCLMVGWNYCGSLKIN